MTEKITLRVNGSAHEVDVQPHRLLLDCLRDDLGFTGPKEGCGIGVCGACTVLVDGRMVSSCLELAVRCDGKSLETVEGLAEPGSDELHPIQRAFIDHGGFQCGICTPGMIMTTKALLAHNPQPTEDEVKEWMMGNLCRCTGYYKILESVLAAAASMSEDAS